MADPYRTDDSPGLVGPFQQLARMAWQVVLAGGLISLALGIMILVWPKQTLWVVGVLFGVYLVVIGIVQVVAAFGTHVATALRVLAFVSGAICVLLGLLCFRSAAQSILLLALWIGIGWLFRGITHLSAVASDPLMPARGWQGFVSVLYILAGILLMVFPAHSITALAILAGVALLVVGVTEVVAAMRIRGAAKLYPREL
ncbi:HdeD family acid-resistance protein [Kitasatospora sp. NPDC004614]|uniref:HdeD family acid-resistance protein n=1 Tax=unclassified Kitasatospora TaxID=2633591 RepID=UPI003684A778